MRATELPADAALALRHFRLFCQDLFAVRAALRNGAFEALMRGSVAANAAGTLEERLSLAVRLRLREAIAGKGYGAPPSADGQVDPGYVYAALADAMLLSDLSWPGRALWLATPLELVMYRSRIAGDRIFQTAEQLLRRRAPDSGALAITILLALSIGYRGRYLGLADGGEIERLRARLFDFVFKGAPVSLASVTGLCVGGETPLVPYGGAFLPVARPWIRAIIGLVILYLAVSRLVWWWDLRSLVRSAGAVADALSALQ